MSETTQKEVPIVLASFSRHQRGTVAPARVQTPDGGVVDARVMILGDATREDFERSRAARGIAHLPPQHDITDAVFHFVTTD